MRGGNAQRRENALAPSAFHHANQRGVALVVTLLMLVVITTMAVAFLLLSQRETASVTALHSTTDAALAADAGIERAKAHVLAPFLDPDPNKATNEVMGPDFIVSGTNDLLGPLATVAPNVLAPVIVNTNRPVTVVPRNQLDDRSYLDLNRNGRFEPTGFVDDNGMPGQPGNQGVEWRVGDPMWLGILQDPRRPHGRDNHFIARYCYLIQPVGRTLDANWLHNNVRSLNLNLGQPSGYYRNQGVGTWELNFGAFLADLNTNQWGLGALSPYRYDPFQAQPGSGSAFEDAMDFLRYRSDGNLGLLRSGEQTFGSTLQLFGNPVPLAFAFRDDLVDDFGNGPVMPFNSNLSYYANAEIAPAWADNSAAPWPGAGSPRNFHTLHDFFDPVKLPGPGGNALGFRDRLKNASAQQNAYDRYTYYRMLSQLGTDSTPEPDDRLNINYKRVDTSTGAYFTNWTALDFFTNAVDRLLTNEFYPFGLTNIGLAEGRSIPVYTNPPNAARGTAFVGGVPLYSPRIHQLIQIAANIYEATITNKVGESAPYLPSVFRPVFEVKLDRSGRREIHIATYVDETAVQYRSQIAIFPNPGGNLQSWYEFEEFLALNRAPTVYDNLYDIPLVFGARKGLPSLNEVVMHNIVQVTRRLEFERVPPLSTNKELHHAFIIGVSNAFGLEMWNAYSNVYPRDLEVLVVNQARSWLTNGTMLRVYQPTNIILNYPKGVMQAGEIHVPPATAQFFVPNSVFRVDGGHRLVPEPQPLQYDMSNDLFTNRWGLTVSNRLLYFVFDSGRLVDAFCSARLSAHVDVSARLESADLRGGPRELAQDLWDTAKTARSSGPWNDGVDVQVRASRGRLSGFDDNYWRRYDRLLGAGFDSVLAQTTPFNAWFEATSGTNLNRTYYQTPFNPSRKFVHVTAWQVNDPLLHYTVENMYPTNTIVDVSMGGNNPAGLDVYNIGNRFGDTTSISNLNHQLDPWGSKDTSNPDPSNFEYVEKDAGVTSPELWDFPYHLFPNLGWLGRVHRGTPWQTIYLKADDPAYSATLAGEPAANRWAAHTAYAYMDVPDVNKPTGYRFPTYPTNDWRLLDVFTTAIHPNATRGRLSINQTNPAVWAAVLGGVTTTLMSGSGGNFVPSDAVVPPAALGPDLLTIVEGINQTRDAIQPVRQFKKLSEFMAVPQLTLASPYLPQTVSERKQRPDLYPASDADYERIPQQILSLVKVGEPRYVVYAWGQSLKPAGNVPGLGFGIDAASKVPVNYQVTGEMATRAVVKIEYEYTTDSVGRTVRLRPRAVVESFNILPND